MNSTVPLWAFVTLGVVAPLVTLIGVIITAAATSRREHRIWLYQTKYESYERLFSTYSAMCSAYADYLNADPITPDGLRRLATTAKDFKHQMEKTSLIASLRVGFHMDAEMLKSWIDIHWQIEAAAVGKPPPRQRREWGESRETRDAVRYDLRVRRDPGGWLARRWDRGTVVPSKYVRWAVRNEKAKQEPAMTFVFENPYAQPPDEAPEHPSAASP